MANDNGLVDEYERIQNMKKELDIKEEELKKDIIKLANEKNTGVLFGTNKKCLIKEYTKIVYPENKTVLVDMIKERGFYNKVSSVNYLKLSNAIMKEEIDKEISDLTKKEKAFMLSLNEIRSGLM